MLLPWNCLPDETTRQSPFDGEEYLLASHQQVTVGFWKGAGQQDHTETWSTFPPLSPLKFWRELPCEEEVLVGDPYSSHFYDQAQALSKLLFIQIRLRDMMHGQFIWREATYAAEKAQWVVQNRYYFKPDAILRFALIDHPPSPPWYPQIEGPPNPLWF
ncbi:hypothetical protein BAE47_07605 [Acidithiobacillus thiooxidans]|nr:hypothetical protein A6O26_00295 [Acidithiobacillus thiooxidans]OFC48548.1 hypothetical protein BAE47_07605 [Acidithiobacillus thiooxidans]